MHELSICRRLLRQVDTLASAHPGRLSGVHLQIGALSGIEPALLTQAFEQAKSDSRAAQAVLQIEWIPVQVNCPACGVQAVAANDLACPRCGSLEARLCAGTELLLKELRFVQETPHVH